jgi:hypothetical protein
MELTRKLLNDDRDGDREGPAASVSRKSAATEMAA